MNKQNGKHRWFDSIRILLRQLCLEGPDPGEKEWTLRLGLPGLANKNIGCLIKFEFLMNNEQFLQKSMSQM